MNTAKDAYYRDTRIWRVLFLLSLFIILFLLYYLLSNRPNRLVEKPIDAIPSTDTLVIGDSLCGNRYLQLAVLYQQRSAEFKALSYQAFNVALSALKEDLKDKRINKPRAVVTDIDETILDNSPYQAECIIKGISYPEGWNEWCMRANAKPLPGALEFCQLVVKYGVDIIYISNRKEALREATLKNLLDLGFPVKDEDHLMMRTGKAEKISHRKQVEERFHISLFLGDNLNDFHDLYYDVAEQRRNFITDSLNQLFGRRYIVFPNPMYGDWESVFYKDIESPDPSTRMQRRDSLLILPGKHLMN